ncbi:MAG: N-acetylmuramoyl-L-alanine amidase [Sphingomicrobium sp.]
METIALIRTLPKRVLAIAAAAAFAAGAALLIARGPVPGSATAAGDAFGGLSNAGTGSLTIGLPAAAAERIYAAPGARGRPIVVIDPGHGGHDPGARSPTDALAEKELALTLARELRDALVKRGRVRVAMTRDDDRYLSLEERAAVARRLGAGLFVSLHMDSAPNPLARGASVYSLSDVASDAEAARFASDENRGAAREGALSDPVAAVLSDLAMRTQMGASADFAARLVTKATGRVGMRPDPHRFAAFHVLRRSGTPAVLVEAGYLSNAEDEVLLRSPAWRAALVAALAAAIEADIAAQSVRAARAAR